MTDTLNSETYEAKADAERARVLAATESPFTITVRFLGGLTDTQMGAFAAAADRWVRVIVGDLPNVRINGEIIDDVLILAKGEQIDGVGDTLAKAGPTHVRPMNSGAAALIPARGIMTFDTADLARLEANGTLTDVITHEMGHVLGIGTLWEDKGLLNVTATDGPTFTGVRAIEEYRLLRGAPINSIDEEVPVENEGGPGTAGGHWRESVFGAELMTGFVDQANPLSRLTIASLGDFGYQVDLDAADPYALPDGALEAKAEHADLTVVRLSPIVLSLSDLRV